MGQFDPRVDEYIAKAAPFAQPILTHLRDLVHRAYPEIEEKIKWGAPHFDYKGPVCMMAAFKAHCSFGFWKAGQMPDPMNILNKGEEHSAGSFGRIIKLSDLPDDETLTLYICNAAALNEQGVKTARPKPTAAKVELTIPDYFQAILDANPEAKEKFEAFSNSHRKEYLQWITEAKTEATRDKRMQTAVEWITEGKSRHWKYQ